MRNVAHHEPPHDAAQVLKEEALSTDGLRQRQLHPAHEARGDRDPLLPDADGGRAVGVKVSERLPGQTFSGCLFWVLSFKIRLWKFIKKERHLVG